MRQLLTLRSEALKTIESVREPAGERKLIAEYHVAKLLSCSQTGCISSDELLEIVGEISLDLWNSRDIVE